MVSIVARGWCGLCGGSDGGGDGDGDGVLCWMEMLMIGGMPRGCGAGEGFGDANRLIVRGGEGVGLADPVEGSFAR